MRHREKQRSNCQGMEPAGKANGLVPRQGNDRFLCGRSGTFPRRSRHLPRSPQATRKQMKPATQRRKKTMTAPSIRPNRTSCEWLAGTSAVLKTWLFLLTLYAIRVISGIEHQAGQRPTAAVNQNMTRKRPAGQDFVPGFDSQNAPGRRCQAGCLKSRRRRLIITAAKRS